VSSWARAPESPRAVRAGPRRYFEARYETASRDEIVERQWQEFRRLLRRAREASPFYRGKFDALGLHPSDIEGPEDLTRVPATTKEELLGDIEEHPPYGSRLQIPASEVVNLVETSGTSGKGREVHPQSAEDLETMLRAEAYGFVWAGVARGTVVALTWPVTMTAGSTWWLLTLLRLGANVLRIGHLGSREKLQAMARYGTEVLVVTPSYLARLEQVAGEVGVDLPEALGTLRAIIVAGEGRTAEWARRVEARWGAKLYEQWGCTQGALAWTCEEGMLADGRPGVLHTLPHLCLTEVVGLETGKPVASGEDGEIMITPLSGVAAPLIRFATRDRARFVGSTACPCGRPFDALQCGSVSRLDEMLKIRGVNVWPSAIARCLEAYPVVREHRGDVSLDEDGREVVLIELEFVPGLDARTRAEIARTAAHRLSAEIGVRFEVREWAADVALESVILDSNTGKARRWVDRRAR
jgi:phenylacetate-CoA ligase